MSTYTSSQSGNWSSASTWGGSGPPVAGDTVTIAVGHTVTITGADAACATLTGNGSSTTYGALVIGTGSSDVRTLTITGNMTMVGGWSGTLSRTVTLGAGSSLYFNPGSGNTSTLTLGDVTHQSGSQLQCNGTAFEPLRRRALADDRRGHGPDRRRWPGQHLRIPERGLHRLPEPRSGGFKRRPTSESVPSVRVRTRSQISWSIIAPLRAVV